MNALQSIHLPYLFLENPFWAALFLGSYFAYMRVIAWVNRKEHDQAGGADRDSGSRTVIYRLSLAGLGLALAAPYLMPAAAITLPHEPVFIVALLLLWSGTILYPWSAATLGTFFRTQVMLLDGQRLVTRGPYRILRHPAYTGGILVYAGFGLAMGNWLSFAAAPLLLLVAYRRRIDVEEAVLRERFGADFEAYRRRTWALVPLLW